MGEWGGTSKLALSQVWVPLLYPFLKQTPASLCLLMMPLSCKITLENVGWGAVGGITGLQLGG